MPGSVFALNLAGSLPFCDGAERRPPREAPRLLAPVRIGLVTGIGALFFALVAADVGAQQTDVSQALPVAGEAFAGRIVGIDSDWKVTVATAGGTREIAAADLVCWGEFRDRDRGPQVVLADGGVLLAGLLTLDSESLRVDSRLFGELTFPLELVRGVVLQPPTNALNRDRLLRRVEEARGGEDQLLLDNGDILKGTLTEPTEAQRKAANMDGEHLWLSLQQGQARPIPLARVVAVVFNPALVDQRATRGLHGWLGFRDGSRLEVRQVDQRDGLVTLGLLGGVRLRTDEESFREQLTYLQPRGPRVSYLSDLPALGYKHIPFLELTWEYGRDRSVVGGGLRRGRQLYFKGIGMHSTARLVYDVPPDSRRFAAELALDQQAGRRGSVVYRVFLFDADSAWKSAYESPVIRGGDAPVSVTLDVSKTRRLALIVDFADRADELDHANWLDARFER